MKILTKKEFLEYTTGDIFDDGVRVTDGRLHPGENILYFTMLRADPQYRPYMAYRDGLYYVSETKDWIRIEDELAVAGMIMRGLDPITVLEFLDL
jgi:hypothetical protein